MTREEMLDRIIHKFGYEHEYTIKFAELCEIGKGDTAVDAALEAIMEVLLGEE